MADEINEIKDSAHFFYARNGAVLKNICELFEFLQNIDDETFTYHFNEQKNDFANWVGDTLKMDGLSKEMYLAKNREELCDILREEVEKPFDELKEKINIVEIEDESIVSDANS